MRRMAIILGGLLFAQNVLYASDGDVEHGRKLARQCKTCHGLYGYAKIPIAPHIGGEPVSYITRQLKAFRDGSRKHEIMTVVAKGLDDQSIADIASWYSSQQAAAALADGTDEGAAPKKCVACHGANGLSEIPDAPNLAGETVMYIDTQLKAFRNGKRTHEIMSEIASELTDENIRSVAEWYANIKFEIKQANE